MSVAYGLAASVLIGISDFLGARASGRSSSTQAVNTAFWAGAAGALVVAPFAGTLDAGDLGRGAVSGVALAAALWALWQAYVVTSVGVAAPLAAVVGAVVPVVVETFVGDGPGPLGTVGIVVGVGALLLTSWAPDGDVVRAGVGLGVGAGLAFAVMFLVSTDTSPDSGLWPLVSQRTVAAMIVTAIALGRRRRPFGSRSAAGWSALAGVTGSFGVGSIILGGQRGPVGPIVVAGSLYPAVTIALAWAFRGERLRWWQVMGLAAALVGVALIAAD